VLYYIRGFMFKSIYEFLFPTKEQKIRKKIEKMYEVAIAFQRNGNIREYSRIMSEIRDLEEELMK